MGTTIEELEGLFDDHPSLDASLQDFEQGSSEMGAPSVSASSRFGYRSHHSGFRSDSESEMAADGSDSGGRFSPPAWRRDGDGNRSSGFWGSKHGGGGGGRSRESSPEYESADDGEDQTLATALRTRLPTGSLSPEKQGSPSPEVFPSGGEDFGNTFGGVVVKQDGEVAVATPSAHNCMSHVLPTYNTY